METTATSASAGSASVALEATVGKMIITFGTKLPRDSTRYTGGGGEGNLGRSPIPPTADPAEHQGQGSDFKSKAKDVLGLARTAVQMLLKRVEPFLDGTPAKGPVAAANALIKLKDVRFSPSYPTPY